MRSLLRFALLLVMLAWCLPARATITYVGAGAIQGTTTTTDAVAALPANTTLNDILIVTCFVRNTGDTMDVSGYSNSFNGTTAQVDTASGSWSWWWKRHDGSEGTATCNKDQSADSSAQQHAFRGAVASGDPWNAVGTPEADVAGNNYTITTLSTALANSMVIALTGYQDDDEANLTVSGTDPSAYTEVYTEVTTSTSDSAIGVSYAIRTAAGATGTVTVDFGSTDPDTDPHGSILLSLSPCTGICYAGRSCTATNAGSGNTVNCTITNQVAGNMNVVTAEWCVATGCDSTTSGSSVSFTDGASNSYSTACGSQANHTTSGFMVALSTKYDPSIATSASNQFTATVTGAWYLKIFAIEVEGQDTSTPCDQSGSSIEAGSGSPISVSTGGATAQNDELVYAIAASSAAITIETAAYSALSDSGGVVKDEYNIVTTTGTKTATWTHSGTVNALATITTWKKASAGAVFRTQVGGFLVGP